MRRVALLFALVIAMLPAHARLGENEAETIARYGPLLAAYDADARNLPYRTLTFRHDGFNIVAQFIDSDCDMVCFQKPNGEALTEDELDLLLKSESNDGKWSRSLLVSTDILWDRPDGAMARYDVVKHALAFCSARYLKADDARRKQDARRQLENL